MTLNYFWVHDDSQGQIGSSRRVHLTPSAHRSGLHDSTDQIESPRQRWSRGKQTSERIVLHRNNINYSQFGKELQLCLLETKIWPALAGGPVFARKKVGEPPVGSCPGIDPKHMLISTAASKDTSYSAEEENWQDWMGQDSIDISALSQFLCALCEIWKDCRPDTGNRSNTWCRYDCSRFDAQMWRHNDAACQRLMSAV